MHQLIASPFLSDYLLLHPGHPSGVRIPEARYNELRALTGLALFTSIEVSCSRVWEAPRSTAWLCSRVSTSLGYVHGQQRDAPAERALAIAEVHVMVRALGGLRHRI